MITCSGHIHQNRRSESEMRNRTTQGVVRTTAGSLVSTAGPDRVCRTRVAPAITASRKRTSSSATNSKEASAIRIVQMLEVASTPSAVTKRATTTSLRPRPSSAKPAASHLSRRRRRSCCSTLSETSRAVPMKARPETDERQHEEHDPGTRKPEAAEIRQQSLDGDMRSFRCPLPGRRPPRLNRLRRPQRASSSDRRQPARGRDRRVAPRLVEVEWNDRFPKDLRAQIDEMSASFELEVRVPDRGGQGGGHQKRDNPNRRPVQQPDRGNHENGRSHLHEHVQTDGPGQDRGGEPARVVFVRPPRDPIDNPDEEELNRIPVEQGASDR